MSILIFILFAGLALGCAFNVVWQRNPLYSAISLIGVFLALAGLYVTLASPFIAAVQVIVYAGAIMVLFVFVIMLLNVEEEEHRATRLRYLIPAAGAMGGLLLLEAMFMLSRLGNHTGLADPNQAGDPSTVGLTESVGTGLFTTYLLPFEITSLLLLMAMVGAMTLARRGGILSEQARVVPGVQVLAKDVLNPLAPDAQTALTAHTTAEAARLLGVTGPRETKDTD
jgi:NADH-quinone oxidoreductase subunit J